MALFLDMESSTEFWRRRFPPDRAPRFPAVGTHDLGRCAYAAADVLRLAPDWLTPEFLAPISGKVHALVSSAEQRRSSSRHVTRTWSAPVPAGSFHQLNSDVFVASPEFAFLMAAATLDRHALIAFGCELCGLYGFDESAERGFRTREVALTSLGRLRSYLDGAKGCPGYRKAVSALPHLLERSASPMETFDAMALFGTYHLGGYCLGRPVMNYEVPLNERAARIAQRSKCFADMCLPDARLDIEHHGRHDHSSPERRASDRARVNALREMGFTVIELTSDQVNDLLVLEYIAQQIASMLGKRLDKSKLGPTPARLQLRRSVFAWNHSAGRLR